MKLSRFCKYSTVLLCNLLLVEVVTRAVFAVFFWRSEFLWYPTGRYRKVDNSTMHPSARRYAHWKFVPDSTRFHESSDGSVVPVRINNYGFRGGDFKVTKDPGTVRIAALGASSTFGFLSADDDTYPRQLERALNQQCEQRYEVYNFGVPHLESPNIVSLLENEVTSFGPDYVTFYEGANDAGHDPPGPFVTVLNHLGRGSLFAELGLRVYQQVRASRAISSPEISRLERSVVPNFVKSLTSLNAISQRARAKLILLSQQYQSTFLTQEQLKHTSYREEVDLLRGMASQGPILRKHATLLLHAVLMEQLRDFAMADSVEFIDLIPILDAKRTTLLTHVHLSTEGNHIIASALAKKILAESCRTPRPVLVH